MKIQYAIGILVLLMTARGTMKAQHYSLPSERQTIWYRAANSIETEQGKKRENVSLALTIDTFTFQRTDGRQVHYHSGQFQWSGDTLKLRANDTSMTYLRDRNKLYRIDREASPVRISELSKMRFTLSFNLGPETFPIAIPPLKYGLEYFPFHYINMFFGIDFSVGSSDLFYSGSTGISHGFQYKFLIFKHELDAVFTGLALFSETPIIYTPRIGVTSRNFYLTGGPSFIVNGNQFRYPPFSEFLNVYESSRMNLEVGYIIYFNR